MKILVLGGSFGGVHAACALARAGHDVTLCDEHSYLGGDVVAAQHTFVRCGETGAVLDEPNGRTKMTLYAAARDAGVRVLLMARLGGLFTDGTRAVGAALATKFGLFGVRADAVLDATECGAAAFHLTGRRAAPREAEYGFDLERAPALMDPFFPMPSSLGLVGDRVTMLRAMRPETIHVSFRFPVRPDAAFGARTAIERRAHELMIAVTEELRKTEFFAEADVLLSGAHTRLFYGDVPRDGRVCALPAALGADFSLAERAAAEAASEAAALDYVDGLGAAGAPAALWSAGREIAGWTLTPGAELGLETLRFDAAAQDFPILTADAVVAGAGTGGAMAGWALAGHGADVLLLDNFYWCGGTNTVGRVYSAWHGYTDGAYGARLRAVKALPEAAALSGRMGAMRFWETIFSAPNARFVGGVTVCGALREGRRLTAALVCGAEGFALAQGRFLLDGTADGDVVAAAGVPYVVGGGRDGFVQSSSMWGWETNRVSNFVFTHYNMDQDVIDPDSYADLLRGLGLGYRGNSEYEIVEMCMQRESRRFACRAALTMAGIARRETHPDDVAVSLCTHDTHGRASSLMNTLHLFSARMTEPGERDIRVRIPLGIFLPEGLDNAALVGKSMGGEREALNLCRMNPEISNTGYAVGLAVAHALAQGAASMDALDLAPVQKELREKRILPDWAAAPGDTLGLGDAEAALDDASDGGFAAMVQPAAEIVPRLLKALDAGGVRAENAALALAWHGRAEGVPILLAMLERERVQDIAALRAPTPTDAVGVRADGFSRIVNPDPNYGYVSVPMNDPDFSYSRVNRLLALLGLAGGGEAVPAILAAAETATAGALLRGKKPYPRSRLDTHSFSGEARVWALACAAERLGDRRLAAPLERILSEPALAGQCVTEDWSGVTPPKSALLEIGAARAAAHCGSRLGAERLVGYLDDARSVFRKMAARALTEAFGRTLDADGWRRYLASTPVLPAAPYRGDPYEG